MMRGAGELPSIAEGEEGEEKSSVLANNQNTLTLRKLATNGASALKTAGLGFFNGCVSGGAGSAFAMGTSATFLGLQTACRNVGNHVRNRAEYDPISGPEGQEMKDGPRHSYGSTT